MASSSNRDHCICGYFWHAFWVKRTMGKTSEIIEATSKLCVSGPTIRSNPLLRLTRTLNDCIFIWRPTGTGRDRVLTGVAACLLIHFQNWLSCTDESTSGRLVRLYSGCRLPGKAANSKSRPRAGNGQRGKPALYASAQLERVATLRGNAPSTGCQRRAPLRHGRSACQADSLAKTLWC